MKRIINLQWRTLTSPGQKSVRSMYCFKRCDVNVNY